MCGVEKKEMWINENAQIHLNFQHWYFINPKEYSKALLFHADIK
jgi:hypothetical protein